MPEKAVFSYGLKLWSTNENYVNEAVRLYEQGVYQYIELFAVPDSYKKFINIWKTLDIPYVIHAPHFKFGFNLAKKECFDKNMQMAKEVFSFADDLDATIIIFHPGIDGDIHQTAYQIKKIFDPRVVIENKPYYALVDNLVCNGHSPEEIELVMQEAGVGFCMDVGHAICAANAKKIDPFEYLQRFKKLGPRLFHLSDGNAIGVYDEHKHLGQGSFDIKKIIDVLPLHCSISIETNKDFEDSLKDFEADICYLNELTAGCVSR